MTKLVISVLILISITGFPQRKNYEQVIPGTLSISVIPSSSVNEINIAGEPCFSSCNNSDLYIIRPSQAITENTRYNYYYDLYGRITSWTTEKSVSNSWVYSSRYLYNYNSSGLLNTWIKEDKVNQLWKAVWKYTYTYNNQGLLTSAVLQQFSNGIWININKISYGFNGSGILVEKLLQNWMNGDWLNISRSLYLYSNERVSVIINLNWSGNAWENTSRVLYTFGSTGLLSSVTSEMWINNCWQNNDRINYTYQNENLISELLERFDSTWNYEQRYTYTYDVNDNLTSKVQQDWTNNCWSNVLKTSNTYDNNWNITAELTESWVNGSWNYNWLYMYEHDENRNTNYGASYKWRSGWDQETGHLIFYFNNNLDYLYFNNQRASISYQSFTAFNEEDHGKPGFNLEQNFPNPFNPVTLIKYYLPVESRVQITIYNSLGQIVRELKNEIQPQGAHNLSFNASGLTSGIYFCSMISDSPDSEQFHSIKKMVLLK